MCLRERLKFVRGIGSRYLGKPLLSRILIIPGKRDEPEIVTRQDIVLGSQEFTEGPLGLIKLALPIVNHTEIVEQR